ncbi:hypothetical protein DMN91_009159 [Ooceraea biroi]|uniref:Uncharacterized protein n=1 Tax=Ooceraea biroi TaxID=2015173 RepID=A0A3L8DF29_OOCBI|nr:hypothetical protein DMN91_009159 [Ooceraea biroi]
MANPSRGTQGYVGSVAEYEEKLKRLAQQCEFGAFLDDALRDQLVCGVLNEHIRQKLLGEATMAFNDAVKIAVLMELAAAKTKSIAGREDYDVSKVVAKYNPKGNLGNSRNVANRNKPECYRCGNQWDKEDNKTCIARGAVYNKCSQKGHFEKVYKTGKSKQVNVVKDGGGPSAASCDVDAKIDELVENGLWTPVSYSEWASPLVVVRKKSGDLRLYIDYKGTVNPSILRDIYPIPRIEDIVASLAQGQAVFVRASQDKIVKWWPGEIVERKSPATYIVKTKGKERLYHVDEIKENVTEVKSTGDNVPDGGPRVDSTRPLAEALLRGKARSVGTQGETSLATELGANSRAIVSTPSVAAGEPGPNTPSEPIVRRSQRVCKKPDRFTP